MSKQIFSVPEKHLQVHSSGTTLRDKEPVKQFLEFMGEKSKNTTRDERGSGI